MLLGLPRGHRPIPSELSPTDVTDPRLLLVDDGGLRIFYAPFDWVNTSAAVVLVGITPGRSQALLALKAVQGTSDEEEWALFLAKRTAAFAGGMRRNLVSMLDEIGVADAVGIETTASLFGESAALLHSTSAILYPVFVGDENDNYHGSSPGMLRHPVLRGFIEEVLAADLDLVPHALVVPLGSAVVSTLRHLSERGALDEGRCLLGLPHPSPANGHRPGQFAESKAELASTVRRWADRDAPI